MQSIYDTATLQEIYKRIDTLKPDSQRQWGKMDVAQMMAHCSAAVEVTLGDTSPKSTFMGKILGRFVKSVITNEKPFKPNMPTDPSFVQVGQKDFDREKEKLKTLLGRLSKGGAASVQDRKHPFFGPLTPDEWSTSTVKHMDHHLRQFGA